METYLRNKKKYFNKGYNIKNIYKEYIFEELVKKAFHPSRIKKCLDLGYDTDDL